QPPAEPRRHPPLERALVLGRADAGVEVGPDTPDRLADPQAAQRVERLERVVEQGSLVEDAAHPRPFEEVSIGENVVPQLVDRGHLGEEPVSAEVEAPAVALDGPADAADLAAGFQYDDFAN